MANEEHLEILRRGVEAWNAWRTETENQSNLPDLRRADLGSLDLRSIDLSHAVLHGTDLSHAILRGADLRDAVLRRTVLSHADLRGAVLKGADLKGAILSDAVLSRASLRDAALRRANLRGADLTHASLRGADLSGADLRGADVSAATFGYSTFALDLRDVKGLESAVHAGPSIISVDVLRTGQLDLPAVFLKGCGLSDWEIEAAKLYNPDLTEGERTTITYDILRLQGEQPIQVNPLFVSYSHADAAFFEKLEPQFDDRGIRHWRDVHDMKAGRVEKQIERAIRLNPTVLLVLSEQSVESDWVEWEAAKARELEKERGRDVLCPVALDEAWKTCSWPGPLRRQIEDYHILDFSGWEDEAIFERQFGKLLDGLSLFYRPEQS